MNGYGLYANIVKPPYHHAHVVRPQQGHDQMAGPLGDDPRLAALGVTGTGTAGDFKFGVIPTATGLVFVAGGDDKLHVYDAATGKQIWEARARRGEPRYPVDVRAQRTAVSAGDGVRPRGRPEQGATSRQATRVRRFRAVAPVALIPDEM